MRCVPAAQRETAILNLADENGSIEAVLSDPRDSSELLATCERRDWRIRDPTWRKRNPAWRKSNKVGENVIFVGEMFLFVAESELLCQGVEPGENRLSGCDRDRDHAGQPRLRLVSAAIHRSRNWQ